MSRHGKDKGLLLEDSLQVLLGVHLEVVLHLLPVNLSLSANTSVDV